MGTEPMAAARWRGSCWRLSFMRAEARWERSLRAVVRLFFEVVKCRAVYLVG